MKEVKEVKEVKKLSKACASTCTQELHPSWRSAVRHRAKTSPWKCLFPLLWFRGQRVPKKFRKRCEAAKNGSYTRTFLKKVPRDSKCTAHFLVKHTGRSVQVVNIGQLNQLNLKYHDMEATNQFWPLNSQVIAPPKNLIPRMTEPLYFCHLVSPWHLSKEDLCGALHHITTKVTRDDGVTTKGQDVKPANTMQRPSILRQDLKLKRIVSLTRCLAIWIHSKTPKKQTSPPDVHLQSSLASLSYWLRNHPSVDNATVSERELGWEGTCQNPF